MIVNPGGTGRPIVRHLGEVGPLAAEQVLHVLVAFGEVVDVLGHGQASGTVERTGPPVYGEAGPGRGRTVGWVDIITRMSDDAAREAVVGTWRLRSYEDRDTASQPWFHPYGEHPVGILVYHRSGTLSIQVFPDPAADNPAGAIGYVGTFAIREATTEGSVTSGVLGYHMDAASEPRS